MMKTVMMTAASAALLMLSGMASADQALAQKNACLSCHSVDKKIVGPASGTWRSDMPVQDR